MELSYFQHFFYSVIASAGFAIYINVPKRDVPASAVIGGLGWVLYKFLVIKTGDLVFPYFVATLLIGFLGNVCSYKYKKTSLVYILPGIIPLVPGYSMYYTMFYLVAKQYTIAVQNAADAIFIAMSIASALLVMESLRKVCDTIVIIVDKSIKMGSDEIIKLTKMTKSNTREVYEAVKLSRKELYRILKMILKKED